jgi:hypothetical protein
MQRLARWHAYRKILHKLGENQSSLMETTDMKMNTDFTNHQKELVGEREEDPNVED